MVKTFDLRVGGGSHGNLFTLSGLTDKGRDFISVLVKQGSIPFGSMQVGIEPRYVYDLCISILSKGFLVEKDDKEMYLCKNTDDLLLKEKETQVYG